jgi:FHA domain
MTERREAWRQPARAPLQRRGGKRWAVAAGLVAGWLVLLAVTGSVIGATLLLPALAGLGVLGVLALRALGVTWRHPWAGQMAARPWADGQDVLHIALRHVSEVFVVTPGGSLLAPNLVEVRLNPDDRRSLSERMDPGLIVASAAEVYADEVAAHGARLAGAGPADVRIIADPSIAAGRYHLQPGPPVEAGPEPGFQFMPPGSEFMPPHPQPVYAGLQPGPVPQQAPVQAPEPEPDRTVVTGLPTVVELVRTPVPVLRLVTGGSVAETQMSGARAGRGAVELGLPEVPTVSREHARFTFSDGQWWIANLGRNGLTLNGTPLVAEHPLSHGDAIRWGSRPDALLSRVEIG